MGRRVPVAQARFGRGCRHAWAALSGRLMFGSSSGSNEAIMKSGTNPANRGKDQPRLRMSFLGMTIACDFTLS